MMKNTVFLNSLISCVGANLTFWTQKTYGIRYQQFTIKCICTVKRICIHNACPIQMKPNVSFLSVHVNKSITCQSCYAVHAYSHGRININVNWVCRPLMSAVTGQTQPGLVELEIECYLVSHSVDCQRWRGTSRDDAVHSQVIRLQAVWSRCLQENKKDMFSQPRWR